MVAKDLEMNLKTKTNLVGTIAILCGAFATILAFVSTTFNFRLTGIIVFILMLVYSCLKDEYKDLRCKEIDVELKNKNS